MEYSHTPVLLQEVVDALTLQSGSSVIDCTLGGGGYAAAILECTEPDGKLLGIDLDQAGIAAATARIAERPDWRKRFTAVQGNFRDLERLADAAGFSEVNGIVMDLGLSSGQLQDRSRGFSFLAEGNLDMRFDTQQPLTAADIINRWPQEKLANILREYGEEPLAYKIAARIVQVRTQRPIQRADELTSLVADVYSRSYRVPSKRNPATKVFQALRITVNAELENLAAGLIGAVHRLAPGGRLAVVSYHSLEDRIVKDYFRTESRDCICPPERPVCQCGHKASIRLITRKPVIPTDQEIEENPRSRSAKLRVVEKK